MTVCVPAMAFLGPLLEIVVQEYPDAEQQPVARLPGDPKPPEGRQNVW